MQTEQVNQYRRLITAIITGVCALAALLGLPPEKGALLATLLSAMGTALLVGWSIRPPGVAPKHVKKRRRKTVASSKTKIQGGSNVSRTDRTDRSTGVHSGVRGGAKRGTK